MMRIRAAVARRYQGGDQAHRVGDPTTGRGRRINGLYELVHVADCPFDGDHAGPCGSRRPTPLPTVLKPGVVRHRPKVWLDD